MCDMVFFEIIDAKDRVVMKQNDKGRVLLDRYEDLDLEIKDFAIKNNMKLKDVKVDHKNRNVLDNRKSNLRCSTHSDNLMNRTKQKNNTSGYKGISISRPYNVDYFNVGLKYKGKRYRKCFTNIEDAINWREDKIKELKIFEYKK